MSTLNKSRHTPAGRAATTLIVEVFRLNARLLRAGDVLVADLGLTSARWQVLGAIARSVTPQTVAQLARRMGVYRQGVQRIVNELTAEGFVGFRENLHHRRAKLAVLTKKGRKAFVAVERIQKPWANALAQGIDAAALISANRVVGILRKRLEENGRERPKS